MPGNLSQALTMLLPLQQSPQQLSGLTAELAEPTAFHAAGKAPPSNTAQVWHQ